MSFSTPKLPLAEMLESARRLGYDGIEPRAGGGHAHGIELAATAEQRRQIRRLVEQSGITLCCIATSCRYADPAQAAAQVEQTAQFVDLAGDLNCPRLRVFGGASPQGLSRQDAIITVAQSLRSVADHATARGVTICLETHDAWCDPNDVAEVMRQADHPAVAVNWDVMHTQRVGKLSMREAYDILKPWIRHVHVHDGTDIDGQLRVLPIGTGDYDHRNVLSVLREGDYDGFVSGEWIEGMCDPAFFADHLGPELATLRRYERDLSD